MYNFISSCPCMERQKTYAMFFYCELGTTCLEVDHFKNVDKIASLFFNKIYSIANCKDLCNFIQNCQHWKLHCGLEFLIEKINNLCLRVYYKVQVMTNRSCSPAALGGL